MKAFIFAAGLGKRLAPITDHTPKPLVSVCGLPLIVWHIRKLVSIGITDLVINCHWLRHKLMSALGDGSEFGARILWSEEQELLNTGGGLKNALPLVGDQPFLVINGDVWTDYPFEKLLKTTLLDTNLAHLVMVANPPQHTEGDFSITSNGKLREAGEKRYTYSGIGLYRPELLTKFAPAIQSFPLPVALRQAIATDQISGEFYSGDWEDVGTIERLNSLEHRLQNSI